MFKFLLIGFLLYLVMPSYGQLKSSQPSPALISALQKNNPDTTRLKLFLQLSLSYYFERGDSKENLDTVYILLHEAEKLDNEIQSLRWKPEILCFLGKYYYKTGDTLHAGECVKNIEFYIKNLGSVNKQVDRWKELAFNIEELDTIGLTRINCLDNMMPLYRQLNNKEQEIETLKDIADTHMKQGKLDLAEKELTDIIALSKAIGLKDLHYFYNLLSVTYHLKGDYNKALYYALLTIETMQKTDDTWAIIFYSHVAGLYRELGQTEKSLEYSRIIFKIKPPNPVDYYYIREAGVFVRDLIKQKKEEEARSFLYDFSKKYHPADPYGKASLARTFAFFHKSVRKYTLADKFSEELIRLEPLLGKNNEIRGDVEYDIGQYYFDRKQFAKAGTHFNKALDEAVLNNSANTMKDVNLMLFRTDSSLGSYISAIGHLNQFRKLNDSIFNETKSKQIAEVQAKYETEKKEQNIKLLENESKLQQSMLVQASNTRNWILGAIVLLLIIVGLLYSSYRHKQQTNTKLEMQRLEIEGQNNSLRHLVHEKDWLLREIHHRVKNNLQIVMSLLNSQSAFINNESVLTAIHDSQHRVHAMSLIHQKLYNSDNLSSIDMSFYIRELVTYLAESYNTGQRIRFSFDIDAIDMDVSQAVPLGLILNEAITNAIKYAFPDDRNGVISIYLSQTTPDHFLLSIADNGIGMPPQFKNRKRGSLGMSLIEGLSEDLDGTFSIESKNGTTIVISFVHDHNVKRPDISSISFASTN